jgi:hypothetical protein
MRKLSLLLPFLLIQFTLRGEELLNNDGVIKMVRAGISDEIILALIKSQPGHYELTPDKIIDLNRAHVSDKIILTIIGKSVGESPVDAAWAPLQPSLTRQQPGTPTAVAETPTLVQQTSTPTVAQTPARAQKAGLVTATAQTPTPAQETGPSATVAQTPTPVQQTGTSTPEQETYHGFGVGSLTQAFIGTGWLLTANGTDYKVVQSSNVVESTGIGHKTPDFLLGMVFNTTLRPRIWKGIIKNLNDPHLDAFVSLKFTPGSDNSINGLVFGGAMRIHPNLDIVAGVALTPQNAPSIGFRNAAYLAALSDRAYYSRFIPADLLLNRQQAFDGFPLLNPAGKPFYSGDPLTTQYRNGFFVGVAFPLSLNGLFKSQSGATSTSAAGNTSSDAHSAGNPSAGGSAGNGTVSDPNK